MEELNMNPRQAAAYLYQSDGGTRVLKGETIVMIVTEDETLVSVHDYEECEHDGGPMELSEVDDVPPGQEDSCDGFRGARTIPDNDRTATDEPWNQETESNSGAHDLCGVHEVDSTDQVTVRDEVEVPKSNGTNFYLCDLSEADDQVIEEHIKPNHMSSQFNNDATLSTGDQYSVRCRRSEPWDTLYSLPLLYVL
jgi:hypothetical protein